MALHRGESRYLEKLQTSIANGEFYEAHQMYRSIYFRFMVQGKYDKLMDMLHEGISLMLDRDQQSSAADLAILLVNVLKESKCPPSEEWKSRLCNIFAKIQNTVNERQTFLINFMEWQSGSSLQADPSLRREIANIFWREKNYAQAHKHFLYAKDGESFAHLLIEFQTTQGYKNEVDMFIAQAVLQLLCLREKQTATDTFTTYCQHHPDVRRSRPPFELPLLNFIAFILMVIESGHAGAFAVLCQQYRLSIQRDACYRQYLEKIGQLYFAIQPPTAPGNLQDFLRSLFSDLDISVDDEDVEPLMQMDCGDMD